MIEIISDNKDSFNIVITKFKVRFGSSTYLEEYEVATYLYDKFKYMVFNNWGLKAYHFLKKRSKLLSSVKIK